MLDRRTTRARSRGAAYVEVLVIAGIVLVLGLLAATLLGRGSSDHAEKEAACIKSFACGSGAAGPGESGDVASMVGAPGAASGPAGGAAESKGFWGSTGDIAKGFFVDGLWGTVTGIGHAVIHPIDTVTGIGHVIAHPIDSGIAIKDGLVQAWNDNPERLVGAGIFEIVTLPLAAAKVEKVAKVAEVAEKVGEVAAVASKAAKAEKAAAELEALADAGEAARAAKAAKAECVGGICTGGSCFGAGTPVVTPDGERPIESIAAGDLVMARDPETGETAPRRVERLLVTRDREVLELGIERGDGASERLVVTPEHPFWREGRGFVPVASLEPGDSVRTSGGEARVVSLRSLPDRITVYNFEVETAHTYFVGKTAAWVHNTCVPRPRQIGDTVVVPRTDGSTSIATVVERHPDGRVTVAWDEGGQQARKTVPESALKDPPGNGPGKVAGLPRFETTPMKSQYRGENLQGNSIWGTKVEYLSATERQAYKLEIRDGRVYDATGKLYDTTGGASLHPGGGGRAIFVMDAEGNIFASTEHAVGKFHHSSLMGGEPVAAAGEIRVVNGKVEILSDKSGHYQPSSEFTQQARDVLAKGGVDLRVVKFDSWK